MKLQSTLFVFSALLCMLGLSSTNAHAHPEAPRDSRYISVTGTALTRTTPDMVVWHVVTTTADKSLVRAKEQSDSQMQAILATTRELGVQPEDVQTGFLDVRKEYEEEEYGQWGDFKEFTVTREVTIKQRDISQYDAVLTGLVKSADMEVRHTLETTKLQEIRAQTRLRAVSSARDKAEAMAGALGAKLGDLHMIMEHQDMIYGSLDANSNVRDITDPFGDSDSASTFAPGSIEVEVSVGVEFGLK